LTLLVAGADQTQAWMIADTAVTDPTKSPRHRDNEPKIVPLNGQSLVGFAGHVDHAHEIIETAAALPTGEPGRRCSKGISGPGPLPEIELLILAMRSWRTVHHSWFV
jgi:hypothetical protein